MSEPIPCPRCCGTGKVVGQADDLRGRGTDEIRRLKAKRCAYVAGLSRAIEQFGITPAMIEEGIKRGLYSPKTAACDIKTGMLRYWRDINEGVSA